MGGMNLGQMIFDPLGITGVFDERDSPSSPQGPTPQKVYPTTWNENGSGEWVHTPGKGNEYVPAPQPGYVQGMTGPSTGLYLPDAGAYGPQEVNTPQKPPFLAQWQYSPGKGPQWLEPVDNGVSFKREGDVKKAVNGGWSSAINNGPAKGNRF